MIQRVKYIGGRMIEDSRGELALMAWKDYTALKREVRERDNLRAVNAELLEALEEALLDAGGFGTPGGWIDDAKRAILRAKG